MENLYYWRRNKEDIRRHKAAVYFLIIFYFLVGAAIGGVMSIYCGEKTILFCCPFLLLAFTLMLRIRSRRLRFLSLMTGAEEDEAVVTGGQEP